jgi:hypothetical protein
MCGAPERLSRFRGFSNFWLAKERGHHCTNYIVPVYDNFHQKANFINIRAQNSEKANKI